MVWRRLFGYFPASLLAGLASFGSVFALTRLLSPADYGFYALATTTMGAIYTLSITWAEAAAYRFAGEAQAKGDMAGHVRTLLLLLAASAGAGLILMSGAVLLAAEPALRAALIAAMAAMVMTPVVNAAREMARAQQQVARWSALRICQDVGSFALGTLLAWRTGLGPAAPFVGLASVLAVLSLTEGARLLRDSKDGRFEPSRVRPYLSYGYPVALALMMNIALDAGDRFLIAYFLGPEAVGVYAAGYGIADKTVGLLCAWAAAGGAPLMMEAWERGAAGSADSEGRGKGALGLVSARMAGVLVGVAAPAAVGVGLVARPLAEVMVGAPMRGMAAQVMPWIALAGLMNGVGLYYASEAFALARRTGLRAVLMCAPVALNVALNVVLLPRVGLMGAVYATAAGYAVALVVLGVAGRRLAPLAWPWAEFAKVAGACAAMAVVVRLMPAPGGLAELLVKGVVGAVAYVLAALALDVAGLRGGLRGRLAILRARQA